MEETYQKKKGGGEGVDKATKEKTSGDFHVFHVGGTSTTDEAEAKSSPLQGPDC